MLTLHKRVKPVGLDFFIAHSKPAQYRLTVANKVLKWYISVHQALKPSFKEPTEQILWQRPKKAS